MLRYGDPTYCPESVQSFVSHGYKSKPKQKRAVMSPGDSYETLRLKTLEFINDPDFDEFDRLERAIRRLVYREISYSCAVLLELLYCCKYSYSKSKGAGFGATISHELDHDDTLAVDVESLLHGLKKLPRRVRDQTGLYAALVQSLYNGKIYRIVNDPWEASKENIEKMYRHFVLEFYREHRTHFENNRIYVHSNPNFFMFFYDHPKKMDEVNLKKEFSQKIITLPVGQSFVYLTVCRYFKHMVTLIITVKKQSEELVLLHLYFVDNNMESNLAAENDKTTEELKTEIDLFILEHIVIHEEIDTFLVTDHKVIYPKESLNFGRLNRFMLDGYCAANSIVLVYVFLNFFADHNANEIIDNLDKMIDFVLDLCVSIKRTVVDEYDLWFYVIKNCILTTFIKEFDLNGNESLENQTQYLDIWSDTVFPRSYYTNEGWKRISDVYDQHSERLVKRPRFTIPTPIFNNFFNMYYVKLSYMIVQRQCLETLFGIVLFEDDDETSYTQTVSTPVYSNGVKYYVINRRHYNEMFSPETPENEMFTPQSEHVFLEYGSWVKFVQAGMEVEFASLSGKELLTLTRDGMISNGNIFRNFHIIGINKI